MWWMKDIFWVILEFIIDNCNPFLPRLGVWFWLTVALIFCVAVGLVIYFSL